jgi:hypothetical protein
MKAAKTISFDGDNFYYIKLILLSPLFAHLHVHCGAGYIKSVLTGHFSKNLNLIFFFKWTPVETSNDEHNVINGGEIVIEIIKKALLDDFKYTTNRGSIKT